MGLITVHWVVIGYSFSFAPGTKGFGNFEWAGLRHVGQEPNPDYAATVPHLVYMIYQMMFAIITPAIISGAVVERMSFRAYIIFLVLWTTVVYDSIAHWVWAGWTHTNSDGTTEYRTGFLRDLGALDFAGGTVVHMSSGYSALVACILVGQRQDVDRKKPVVPHNVPFVLLGAAILWFGWFGFNGGSALAANGLAALAIANTQTATGIAFLTWVILDAICKKKVTAVGAASGAVVGLVAITPGAGFVHPASSLAIGAITTIVCYFVLEGKAKYLPRIFPQLDDSLDVLSCHGVGGTVGCLLTGFFASKDVNPAGADGVFFGNPKLLGYQLAAILVTLAFSCVGTLILLLVLKHTIGLTVNPQKLADGLDVSLHGTRAYYYEHAGEMPVDHTPAVETEITNSGRAGEGEMAVSGTPEPEAEEGRLIVEMGEIPSNNEPGVELVEQNNRANIDGV